MQIEDGLTGRTARITKNGQLETSCEVITSELFNSGNGNSYIVGNGVITMSGNEESVLYLKNMSQTDTLHIHSVMLSTDSSNYPYVSMYINKDYISGGEMVYPINLNSSFGDDSLTMCYFGDSLTCGSSLTNMLSCYVDAGMSNLDFGGSVILSYNDSLTFTVNGTSNEHISIYIRFYY